MGKIRVKTFGDEEQELKEKEKLEARKQAKIAEKKASSQEKVEEVKAEEDTIEAVVEAKEDTAEAPKAKKAKSSYKDKAKKKAPHSKNYQALVELVDKTKTYTLSEALELLEKIQRKKFDETVELHLNTLTAGLSGNITLPHGTGKKTKVAIASDALIAEIEKGTINFDVLVAEPSMMAKLAKVAKVLGPKGLMPNPKNGTITPNPEDVAKKYEGGQVNFKTESKTPVMHLTVGKVSFGKEKLSQNINALVSAIKKSNIANATLKSTMSPGIKIKI